MSRFTSITPKSGPTAGALSDSLTVNALVLAGAAPLAVGLWGAVIAAAPKTAVIAAAAATATLCATHSGRNVISSIPPSTV